MASFTCNICGGAEARARVEEERAGVLAERIRLASGSRWLRLGRTFGIGPRFE
jgi:hypothetical protein